jgi:TusA-related sulfurtransferase
MVDQVLDLRGIIIPVTFLKITQILREMKKGETMEIVGNDPDTRSGLSKVLQATPCKLVAIEDEESCYRIYLRKGNRGQAYSSHAGSFNWRENRGKSANQ